MALPWGAPLTYDDLADMPDDGHRYELVDGVLLVTPAPTTAHQRASARLTALLLAAAPRHLEVLAAPYDYVVNLRTALRPDLLVARKEDLGPARLERPPLLVVEILSPSTRQIDRGTKRLAYAAAGVPAYWMVDPDEPALVALRLEGDRYVEEAVVSGLNAFEGTFPLAVTVVPSALLD